MANQNPEQKARDRIDQQLMAAGWVVQGSKTINFNAGSGIAVREYQTDAGPADYVLFVNRQAPALANSGRRSATDDIPTQSVGTMKDQKK